MSLLVWIIHEPQCEWFSFQLLCTEEVAMKTVDSGICGLSKVNKSFLNILNVGCCLQVHMQASVHMCCTIHIPDNGFTLLH